MKREYEKMCVTPLGIEPERGILVSSVYVEENKVIVDNWSSIQFDSTFGTDDQDFVDLTFD